MGKVWGPDAVSKSVSTSFYGNLITLAESPKKEGLLYAGSDDGLISITENAGMDWRRVGTFPGVPERTYVSRVVASQHDPNIVYAAFDNHKNADFKPYLLKSTDAGRSWTSIAGDLPANGPVLAIAEDHVNPQLLFVGTEFGLYFTIDGGKKWTRLKGGFPTIAVRDLAIQRRTNDLVVGTFGRGIYVLDDYTPLRQLKPETLQQDTLLLPVKDAPMYIQTRQYGLRGKAFQGEAFYAAENPPFGATFTYYLKDDVKTRKQRRREAEKEAEKKKATAPYPGIDELRAEDEEESPAILLTVTDASGRPIRTISGPVTKGFHRVSWDLREPAPSLPKPRPPEADDDLFREEPSGPLVMPGEYKVALAERVGGATTPVAQPQQFSVAVEGAASMTPEDRKALFEFQQKVTRLQRAVSGALDAANEARTRSDQIKRAIDQAPFVDRKLADQVRAADRKLNDVLRALRGDVAIRARNEITPESISERVSTIVGSQRFSLARPSQTAIQQYEIASQEFAEEQKKLRALLEGDLRGLEKALDAAGAPWTPGRVP
jgi:hypothetical protein